MLKKFYPSPSLLASDLGSFQRQETIFVVINLILLLVLVFLHHLFASFWGPPSRSLLIAIGFVFSLGVLELFWLQRLSKPLPTSFLSVLTWSSIVVNLALAILLSGLTNHEDSPYFVLMVVPILEAAFRFELATALVVSTIADLSLFFWVWLYFERNPPLEVGEYFEAGTTSVMFIMVAVVVSLLVRGLRERETSLATNLLELQRTRERLLQQERLAAVGRLSSAIAHEIRNPVAMISSSIATAKQLSGTEREEMFDIASEEASRLVRLTTDFLSYARPRPPQPTTTSVADTLSYVVAACRAHTSQRGAQIQANAPPDLAIEVDAGQVQQALINLIMNAVDDATPGSTILLNAHRHNQEICIDVENSGEPIREEALARIFEPFFTTKRHGTGLGLAIARGIALAHGGDLALTANGPQRICFSLILPVSEQAAAKLETIHG
ncbi:MAG: HAMP domain-containing histidine kinase [Acidobacteria bacterium]|nr:HAMP domain-containing histidine kinase [Acidobacteriota bacterium]